VSGAAPLWLEVVNALHQNVPSHAPHDPPGVERVTVTFDAALEPDREELFLPGTQMRRVVHKGQAGGHPAIVYPARGQIIAVDPDIPPDTQRVQFRAVGVNGNAAAGARNAVGGNGAGVDPAGAAPVSPANPSPPSATRP
jgi:penicillin-binding protein 1C